MGRQTMVTNPVSGNYNLLVEYHVEFCLRVFFSGLLLTKICFSGSDFLTFSFFRPKFRPKSGPPMSGPPVLPGSPSLDSPCVSGTFSPAPQLFTLSLLSRRGCVLVTLIGLLTRSCLALGTSAWSAALPAAPPRTLLWLLICGVSDSMVADP